MTFLASIWARSFYKGLTWFLTGLVLLSFFFSSVLLYEQEKQFERIDESNLALIESAENLLQKALSSYVEDTLYLSALPEVLGFQQADPQSIAPLLNAFMLHKPEIVQVRWLDMDGQEVLRFNQQEGRIESVPSTQLQNKRSRYYFVDALPLENGQVAVSQLDLNVEHGQVEQPYRPMIRFSAPMFLHSGEQVGVMVLNVCAKALLRELSGLPETAQQSLMLANEDGFWLVPPAGDSAWGDQLSHPEHNLFKRYPYLGELIQNQFWVDNRWLEGRAHLHAFTVHPFTGETIEPLIAVNRTDSLYLIAHMPETGSLWEWITRSSVIQNFLWSMLVFLVVSSIALVAFFYRRERLQNQSRFQERVFHHFFNRLPEAMILSDAQGEIVFQNEQSKLLEEVFIANNGLEQAESKAFLLEVEPRRQAYLTQTERQLKHGFENRELYIEINKLEHYFLRQTFVVEGESGEPPLLATILVNLTAEKNLQQTMKQSQKMEAIGQLTGGIAHDFNNLLTGIMGNLDLAKRFMPIDENKAIKQIDQSLNASQKASALIKRLMTIARKRPVEAVEVNLSEFLDKEASLLTTSLPSSVVFHWQCDDDSLNVCVDEISLETALINLIANARDAMANTDRDRAKIELNVTRKRFTAAQIAAIPGLLIELQPGDYAEIILKDSGEGLDAALIEKVIEPFFTTKALGQGTGLGLSMVFAFMQQSKGSMAIQSELGQGTQVCLYLPLLEATEEASAGLMVTAEDFQQFNIVAVDDEQDVIEMLRLGLCEPSQPCHMYTSAEEALANHDFAKTDIVISDLKMPGMNGVEFAEALRQSGYAGPILFTTGYMQEEASQLKELKGPYAVMEKPYRMPQLQSELLKLLVASMAQGSD